MMNRDRTSLLRILGRYNDLKWEVAIACENGARYGRTIAATFELLDPCFAELHALDALFDRVEAHS